MRGHQAPTNPDARLAREKEQNKSMNQTNRTLLRSKSIGAISWKTAMYGCAMPTIHKGQLTEPETLEITPTRR
jgi:hypothetical protein